MHWTHCSILLLQSLTRQSFLLPPHSLTPLHIAPPFLCNSPDVQQLFAVQV